MDRNNNNLKRQGSSEVALRKESVDRNTIFFVTVWPSGSVALRKESVDRNKNFKPEVRDWFVALRKESVDRNCHAGNLERL